MENQFPLYSFHGSYFEIGKQHGQKLKKRIRQTIEFYTDVTETLNKEEREEAENDILKHTEHYKNLIEKHTPNQAEEIEGIAKGSGFDNLWIYAINSRTEIMNNRLHGSFTECTAFYFKETKLLGQNWDWSEKFTNLAFLMKITTPNGNKILQMTEPGMIGKIGFNKYGLGVGLNFLTANEIIRGYPIHSTLRLILEQQTIEEALVKIKTIQDNKSSNILIGSATGQYQNIEFSPSDTYYLNNSLPYQIHTNHFLENPKLNDGIELESSYNRYEKACDIAKKLDGYTVNDAKSLLLDKSNSNLPICRKFIPGTTMKSTGTVCSIIMDLTNLTLHITKGSPLSAEFEQFGL